MDQPIRVLLIEDNPADARLIEVMLSEARGLQFLLAWAADLTAGVAHLNAQPTNVVLLDLGLPESTGLDTLQRLLTLTPRSRHVPTLVVLSGLTDEEKDLIRNRDWPGMIHYGVIFFMLEKLAAVTGVSNLHVYAAMRGETLEDFLETRNTQVMYSVAGKKD